MLFRLWLAGKGVASDLLGLSGCAGGDLRRFADAVIDWLGRAQEATADGGVSAGFHLRDGWLACTPETVGCVAETLFTLVANGRRDLEPRAWRMIDWLLTQQRDDGSFAGRHGATAFGVGQALLGLTSAAEADGSRDDVRAAAHDAGRWLATTLDDDGCWRAEPTDGEPAACCVQAARALLRCYRLTRDAALLDAARQNVTWTLQQEVGEGCFDEARQPTSLHAIAYAVSGLLECGVFLNHAGALETARRSSLSLLCDLEKRGTLAGVYAAGWERAAAYRCLTGEAQTAVTWARLADVTGKEHFREGAEQLARGVAATQMLDGSPCTRGAIAGSSPLWGRHARFEYPTRAAKHFVDAVAAVAPQSVAMLEEEPACASAY